MPAIFACVLTKLSEVLNTDAGTNHEFCVPAPLYIVLALVEAQPVGSLMVKA